jgi:hypothetical protein
MEAVEARLGELGAAMKLMIRAAKAIGLRIGGREREAREADGEMSTADVELFYAARARDLR